MIVTDLGNHAIRKINSSGFVSKLNWNVTSGPDYIDGPISTAKFSFPRSLFYDTSTEGIFISDSGNQAIRHINSSGYVSTIAGNGTIGFENGLGDVARFWRPRDVTMDSDRNLYVAETGNDVIRKIVLS